MPAQLTPPSSVSGSPQSGQAAGEFQKPRSRDCPRWGQVLFPLSRCTASGRSHAEPTWLTTVTGVDRFPLNQTAHLEELQWADLGETPS